MTAYNLQAIRELLGEAFSSGEITTLAFDLFHDVYEDFTAGMTRSRKIEMVVEKASKTGQIPTVLAYVQKQNGYQYGRYAPRLSSPSNSTGPDASLNSAQDSQQAVAVPQKAANTPHNSPQVSPRRLKREKTLLESQSELLAEKVRRLQYAHNIETDVARKFQLEKQLEEAESELESVENRLDEIDALLGVES